MGGRTCGLDTSSFCLAVRRAALAASHLLNRHPAQQHPQGMLIMDVLQQRQAGRDFSRAAYSCCSCCGCWHVECASAQAAQRASCQEGLNAGLSQMGVQFRRSKEQVGAWVHARDAHSAAGVGDLRSVRRAGVPRRAASYNATKESCRRPRLARSSRNCRQIPQVSKRKSIGPGSGRWDWSLAITILVAPALRKPGRQARSSRFLASEPSQTLLAKRDPSTSLARPMASSPPPSPLR